MRRVMSVRIDETKDVTLVYVKVGEPSKVVDFLSV